MALNGLASERFWDNKAECDDAERKYYLKLSGAKVSEPSQTAETKPVAEPEPVKPVETKPAAPKDDSDDVDLFASDEEDAAPKAKPQLMRVQPKGPPASVLAKQKEQQQASPKKQGKADKVSQPEKPAKEAENKKPSEPSKPAPEVAKVPTGPVSSYKNPANGERTFLMLKPDAVQRNQAGEIIARFEKKGYKLVAMKLMRASTDLLSKHYADLSKKPFFPELIRYMASGPVLPMVWEGLNAVKTGRVMLGETNPRDSAPGTIRGDYCIDIGRNIIHGSDSVESAQKEIALWFSPAELVSWRPCQIQWIYEDEEDAPEVDELDMAGGAELVNKLNSLELENKNLKKVTDDLRNLVLTLEKRIANLETKSGSAPPTPAKAAAAPAKPAAEDDDDVDLFGDSDEEEDAEAARVREERLKAYAEKKSKKPALIAKTSVLLDVKPWDDETDMDAMLKSVKTIEKEGLVWGASKLVPVGYGINKLQVMCVVEDEKVSIDELCEQIQEFEDFVQSVDIAAMSKI